MDASTFKSQYCWRGLKTSTITDHGTDLQQKSPTSPQQHGVKCETLHQKYFETVAYTAAALPERASTGDCHHVNPTAISHAPPNPDPPTSVVSSTLADSHQSNKSSVPHNINQSSDLNPPTSVDNLSDATSVQPAADNLASTSKLPSECHIGKPLETNFPVEPHVVVKAKRPVARAVSNPLPSSDRLRKKGIKTTPLIKTTLRTTAGKPKSPLVARVTRPAIAIKTTVCADIKSASAVDKSKETSDKIKKSTSIVDKTKETSDKTNNSACVVDKSKETSDKIKRSASVVDKKKETSDKTKRSASVVDKSKEKRSASLVDKSKETSDTINKSARGVDKSKETSDKVKQLASVVDTSKELSIKVTKLASVVDKSKETTDTVKVQERQVAATGNIVKESKSVCEYDDYSPEIIIDSEKKVEEVVDKEHCGDLNCELSVIKEEITAPDLKDYIEFSLCKDRSSLDEIETASDSLRVNVDTDSINTITDPIDEDFCTQYSEADSEENFCDSKQTAGSDSKETGDHSLISNESTECKTDSALDLDDDLEDISEELGPDKTGDIVTEDGVHVKDSRPESKDKRLNRIKAKSASLNRKSHDDPGLPFDQARPVLNESGSRLSILRNWNDNLRSLYNRNRSFDSENSSYASFYSIDNCNVETSLASKSRKLKWTPRISETEFSSVNSGNFSDCASFYTADTCGTFYSARSFQLDSCDNFQTCEDFQKLEVTPKSKLAKAKEAIQRGKDFVKAKFENYRKHLPASRRSDTKEDRSRFKRLCHHSCGFSCVHLGKEISQYSIPDFSVAKGDNPEFSVEKGDNLDCSEAKGGNPGSEQSITGNPGCSEPDDVQDGGTCSAVPEYRVREDMDMDSKTNTKTSDRNDPKTTNGMVSTSGNPGNNGFHDNSRTVKMEHVVRGTTDVEDDDMPVGTEAISIPRTHRPSDHGEFDERPASKRLRWVSALDKTQGTSLASSFTSNSSVDQLLQQREMDPETLLKNLGFGADPNTDESFDRIPERFVTNPCAARGINLQQFLVNHPELHHLLPMLEQTGSMGDGSCGSLQHNGSEEQSVSSLWRKGSMQRQHTLQRQHTMPQQHSFAGVMHGMRFIREVQAPAPAIPDEEDQKISQIHSVLDFNNRKALARQGFYGPDYLNRTEELAECEGLGNPNGLSAAQRRRQFHHSVKSKSKNWSFTEETDSEKGGKTETHKHHAAHPSVDSFDRGLMLRSFSERFSSDSSLESTDSYGDSRRQLVKQNSISNLRKQYEETIGEFPVFDDLNNIESDRSKKLSIGEVRRKQVDRLMASEEDDGDYVAHKRQSSLKDSQVSALRRAQNSTQSTISGSPRSPDDLKFSFDSCLNDGESEFGFSYQPKSPSPSENDKTVSFDVTIEEPSPKFELPSEEIIPSVSNPNELEPPSLVLRSDSCNTLVSQESAEAAEHLEGELTPRPGDSMTGVTYHDGRFINKMMSGDALSESTDSTRTQVTVQDNFDGTAPGDGSDNEDGQRSPGGKKDSLKPARVCPPQESFELEEISSAEDMNGNHLPKSQTRRGPFEKSTSTHSDSSGFADLDTIGETTQSSIPDIPKETFTSSRAEPRLTKQPTLRDKNQNLTPDSDISYSNHDNSRTSDDPASFHETETIARQLCMEKQVCLMDQVMSPAIEETKALYVCRKNLNNNTGTCDKTTDKENHNPELESISYRNDEKSIVYTVNVPVTKVKKNHLRLPTRYVSKVSMKVLRDCGDSLSTISDRSDNSRIVQVGAVQHEVIGADNGAGEADIEPSNDASIFAEIQRTEAETPSETLKPTPVLVSPRQAEIAKQGLDVKSEIRSKQKAKEALAAATCQTADWLLSNEQQRLHRGSSLKSTAMHINLGRPGWASTPDLKQQPNYIPRQPNQRVSRLREGSYSHSLDVPVNDDDEDNYFQQEESLRKDNLGGFQARKKSRPLAHHNSADNTWEDHTLASGDLRHSSQASVSDESVNIPRYSGVESSIGMPEDHMRYLKLARLINGPSLVMNFDTKMPISRYTPNLKMKNWVDIPRTAHLEEETSLMQHAVQRYKVELSVMETMLTTMFSQAGADLEHEERAEVEELQQLWSEVRREVDKMETLLTDRIKSLRAGNDSYSPLDALQVLQAMIDLLREQLYHQQMCITKEFRLHSDDPDDLLTSSRSSQRSVSNNSNLLSDLSQQVSEVKETVSRSQEMQKQALQETFSELRTSLLAEVKGELSGVNNDKMLQLQLQARDNEIQRLRMELLLQSVEAGKTRKRVSLESDV